MSDESTDHRLFEAVLAGDMSSVQRLLADGVDVNSRQQGGGTPLILAAGEGRLDLTCCLVEHGADVDAQYDAGNTALIEASANGHLDVVKYLVEKGADVHIREAECESPLEWAAGHGHLDVVTFLIEQGAKINTALTGACEWGQAVGVAKYLIAQGADLEAPGASEGFTPLVAAAYQGHIDVIDILVKAGANIHVDDDAPLEWAALFDQLGSVCSLLAAGANPDSRLSRESTALTAAISDPRPNRAKIISALLDAGADVNRGRSNGATALHEAAETGQSNIIRLLVERGADVSTATETGDTPAIAAARHGQLAALRCLGDLGADLDRPNAEGETARSLATDMMAALPGDGER